ncbi:MAG: HEPN domain-containing protein [Myxococcota bacterium]
MASRRDWADAYLAQAEEDLNAARLLLSRQGATSVVCMLLQMVFEKASKAALLRSGQISVRKAVSSHASASTLVSILKRQRRYLHTLGGGDPFRWAGVLPLVQELERAHPVLAAPGQPQLEYPWEDPATGAVMWPGRDLPLVVRLKDPRNTNAPRLMNLAAVLVRLVPELF